MTTEGTTLDFLTTELVTARADYEEAKTSHASARREETATLNEETKRGKRYNELLERLNTEFGTLRV